LISAVKLQSDCRSQFCDYNPAFHQAWVERRMCGAILGPRPLSQTDYMLITRLFRKYVRMSLLGILLLSLCIRVLVPAGYMPSSLATGGPFVICPDGLFNFELELATAQSDTSASGHHGDHHQNHSGDDKPAEHDHEGAGGHSSFSMESCPIGSVLGAAAATAVENSLLIAFIAHSTPLSDPHTVLRSFSSRLYQARAPPLATPFYV